MKRSRVDAARAPGHDVDLDRGAQDHREELLARLDVVLLGVVEDAEGADLADAQRVHVEQDRRRDERAGQATAPGLVGPRDPADAEPAIELEQAPAGAALCRLAPARGRLRGVRSGRAASRWRRPLR
jgi:hypothetical protein